ncbi:MULTISPECIES: head maturation protease, ClpP-related [Bradyrhizobium]|uniref:head maturation protease, ClpP-related n=1 Tax=Bradyrhizobium TaxID=374 RepID=UPI00100929DC|nr:MULTISPECIES: head maturation protease, ClpP-related [Bradyrhizobium]
MRNSIKLPTDKRPSAQRRLFARTFGAGFDVRAADRATEITVFGEIGWDVTAAAFHERLTSLKGDLVVKINSPGGNVFDGIQMHNSLVEYPGKVTVKIMALAASAASIVAMAGHEIQMTANSFFMLHRSWGITVGNVDAHTDTAGLLSKIDGALATTYAARTGQDLEQVNAWMANETWFTPIEAIDAGLADEQIADPDEPTAAFDLSIFAKTPDILKQSQRQGLQATKTELEQSLRSMGMSRSQAKGLLHSGFAGFSNDPSSESTHAPSAAARFGSVAEEAMVAKVPAPSMRPGTRVGRTSRSSSRPFFFRSTASSMVSTMER